MGKRGQKEKGGRGKPSLLSYSVQNRLKPTLLCGLALFDLVGVRRGRGVSDVK